MIPAGSRRFNDQTEALACALTEPALADVRGDFRDNLVAVYRVLVLHASWGGQDGRGQARAPRGVTAPTRARICDLVGGRNGSLSVTTYKMCVRWWKARGYLAVVRGGWSPVLRSGALLDPKPDHNQSQAFVICGPRARLLPSPGPAELQADAPADNPFDDTSSTCGKPEHEIGSDRVTELKRPLTGSRRDPVRQSPTRGRARENQNRALKTKDRKPRRQGADRSPVLRRGLFGSVTDGWWTSITWRYAAAGWTAADIVYAVDHAPDGSQHWQTAAVIVPEHRGGAARLLLWRLRQWLSPDGTPMRSPTQQRDDRARAAKAARERQDAELGLAERRRQLRAQRPHDYDHAGDGNGAARPQDGPRTAPKAPVRLVGWAARYSTTAPFVPAQRDTSRDATWHAVLAAAAAAAAAEEAGDAAAAAAAAAERDRLLARMEADR